MSAQKKFSAVLALGGLFVAILFRPGVEAFRHLDKQSRLSAYEAFLESHPFSETSSGSGEDARHPENPGDRYRQEYLLMIDPALGRVPVERLAAANRSAKLHRGRRGSPGLPGGKVSKMQVVGNTAWEERGPDDVGGRTRAIMFDPNDPQNEKVWAGGVAGGLWYTNDITDPNEPWHNVDDFWSNLAISSIAYDPTDPMTFYAGTGEGFFNFDALRGGGVFKSSNGGTTWDQLPSTTGPTWQRVQDIVVTDLGTVLAATRAGDGVQRSDDGGDTWTPVLDAGTGASTSSAADLEIAANGHIYATMGLFSTDGVWKSDTDGVTWEKLNTGANGFPTSGFYRIEIALAPSDSNRIYAVTQTSGSSNGVGGMYRSVDGGANWTGITPPVDCDGGIGADFTRGQAWYDLILAVKPDDEDVLLAGGIDLFRSDNAGTSAAWNQMSVWITRGTCPGVPVVHADQHAIVFRPGTTTEAVFGTDGGIYYSADVTQNPPVFVKRNNGYNVTQFYAVAQSPTDGSNLLLGGTQDNGTPKLNAAGVSGQVADVTGGDGAFTHVNQTTNVLAMASNQYLNWHRSLNGGNTFSYIGGIAGGSFINPSDLDEDTNHLFFSYSNSAIGRLNNLIGPGNVTATTFGPVGGFGNTVTHLRNSEYSPASKSTVYLGSGAGRIFRVQEAQQAAPAPAWSELNTTPLPTGAISCIELGASEDTLIVTFSNYGISSVWYTTDGGTNWDNLDAGSNLPDMPVWWALLDPFDPQALLIATEAGLWFTEDITANPVVWTAEADIPITRAVMLKYRSSDNQLLLGTHGRGLWTATISAPPPSPPDPRLLASVLLEGPYAGLGAMMVPAQFSDERPVKQPFSDPLFDGTPSEYDGVDSVLSFPTGTIDWILVELRSDPSAASLIADSKRPAILLEDGSVVGLDGDTLRFPDIEPGVYHVVFRHRNHLAVMTAGAFDFAAGPATVDLTTSLAAAHTSGGNAMKSLAGGFFGMFASDGSLDGQITAPDFNLWIAGTTAGLTGYVLPDYNLDGIVTAPDFNIWNANTTMGAASQVEE